jgi:hypothetical protein
MDACFAGVNLILQVGAFSSKISQILGGGGGNGLEVVWTVGQPSPTPAVFQREEDGD